MELSKRLQKKQKQLDNLDRQIIEAQGELDGLQNQVRTARQRRDSSLSEVEELIANKQKEALDVWVKKIEAKTKEFDKINLDVSVLKGFIEDLNDDLDTLNANKDMLNIELGDLIEQIRSQDSKLKAINHDITTRAKDYNAVKEETDHKKTQIIELDQSILDLIREKEVVESDISNKLHDGKETLAQLNIKIDKSKIELKQIEEQLQKRINQLREVADKDKIMRKELATERIRLERLDKNLRVREIQVQSGEEKLQQNAQLLNL